MDNPIAIPIASSKIFEEVAENLFKQGYRPAYKTSRSIKEFQKELENHKEWNYKSIPCLTIKDNLIGFSGSLEWCKENNYKII